jgi:hypothetical protein
METLSVGRDKAKKELLLEELERYGINIPKVGQEPEFPEHTLERLLQEAKKSQDPSSSYQRWFTDLYERIMIDYYTKLTVGTVMFFYCYPWAALFWPPYYYHNKSWKDQMSFKKS